MTATKKTFTQKQINFFRLNARLQKEGKPSSFDKNPKPVAVVAANDDAPKAERAPLVPVLVDLVIESTEVRPGKKVAEYTYGKALCGGESRVIMAFDKVHEAMKGVTVGATIKAKALFNRNKTLTIVGLAA